MNPGDLRGDTGVKWSSQGMHATAERVSTPTSRRPAGKLARRASHRARDYERTEQTLRLRSEHSKNTHGRVLPLVGEPAAIIARRPDAPGSRWEGADQPDPLVERVRDREAAGQRRRAVV
jgi:hypothetical protein